MPRFFLAVVAAVLLGVEAPRPLSAQSPGDSLALAGTRVTVSRREVRVVFPRDTASAWGWRGAEGPDALDPYLWRISGDGVDEHRMLEIDVRPSASVGRSFSSLASLLAAGRPYLCTSEVMFSYCVGKGIQPRVWEERGRVVLVLRDSALIAEWFGLRPDEVEASHQRPGLGRGVRLRVPVRYVDPQVPRPHAALFARAEAARRKRERDRRSVRRYIGGGEPERGAAVWLAVGDSVPVSVQEMRCVIDVCGVERAGSGARWSVMDGTVARLETNPDTARVGTVPGVERWLVGARVGRTRLHVTGLASDSTTYRTPPPVELTREVVVTLPIERVELWLDREELRVGDTLQVRATAFDADGRQVDGAPVKVDIDPGDARQVHTGPEPLRWEPRNAGRFTITATFGGITARRVIEVTKAPPP